MNGPVEHRFATAGGDLCWFEWGHRVENRPTLLLLHATGFHARCWDATIAALPADWHIIALDLRGHGRSYRPVSLSDWLATADDVVEFVQNVCPFPIFLIGHSMGGFVAARTAALVQERTAGLLLVDAVMMAREYYDGEPANLAGDPDDHPVARRRNSWESAEQMIAHFAAREPYMHWQADVLADYCRFGLVPTGKGDLLELACPPVLEASAYMGSWRSNPHDWADRIACPTLVLRARNSGRKGPMDFSVSPTDPALATAIRGAQDLHWPEISHFIPMEVPDRLAAVIESLVQPG